MCCLDGNIYLVGGGKDERKVTEYNPRNNTWQNMPSLQRGRPNSSICTLDYKIFVLGGASINDTTCEMLDLSDDDPHWRYISNLKTGHSSGGAVVIQKKIYALGDGTRVMVYDEDQGM